MPRYKLKPEFLEIGLGLMSSVFPQIGEVSRVTKELGFDSPAPEDLESFIRRFTAYANIAPLSSLGAAVGSPLGLLPFLGDLYSSGIGSLIRNRASRAYFTHRLDPNMVVQLWRRGFPDEERKDEWWQDLLDQGWSEERIGGLQELAQLLPTPQEAIAFLAHEVFEPEMIEKYGLDSEFEALDLTIPRKIGMTDEMSLNFWRNHWQHASWMQIVEMRRRELITDDDVWEWFRLVEIPPYWREKLTALIWEIPTRVDVRRWYDMGTIDETELRSIYGRRGYHGKDLDNYVIWTKVYVHFPDLMARYKNNWITLDEVKHQLVEVDRMPEDRFEELLQTKIKAVQEERVASTTALTRSLIIKGAKEEKLTRDETIELLMLKNYNLWEAEYIYDIEVGAASSPETPMEFRQLVESYRHAVGLEFKEVPPELLEADRKRSELRLKLAQARSREAPEEEISELEAALEIAEVTFQNMKAGYGL